MIQYVRECLSLLLELDEVLDSVVHLLDGLELGQTETSLVRDVVDASLGVGVLSVDTADLELKSVADGFEVGLGGDLGKADMDRGTDGGSEVGGAEGQPSKAVVTAEGHLGLDGLDSLDQTLQHLSDVSSLKLSLGGVLWSRDYLLHGDDTEVVLLIAPDEEGLVLVVEDT